MLKTYRTYNLMVVFLKYEFNNKLMGGATLFRITPSITWTQAIYIYIYIYFFFSFLDNYRVTLPSPPKRKKEKLKNNKWPDFIFIYLLFFFLLINFLGSTTANPWCSSYSTSINICGGVGAKVGIQVSKRKFHTHIILD